ncbi:MAG TPA: purine-nucleoside phosphorylase [Clostridia bacterium]|nr:purine-nucleoside phosphorylase [Clostridia bacterium]
MFRYEDYVASAASIREKIEEFAPDFLMILGSGLGFLADGMEGAIRIPYAQIPGFAPSTAPGHAGRLVFGGLSGRRVMAMQGRMHAYEGYSQEQLAFPVRVAKLLGAQGMVVTNACGGINERFSAGELMAITDFINPSQASPLTGPNEPRFGERFCDMGDVFTGSYREIAARIAQKLNIVLREGVYCYAHGPQFETPAEIRSFRILGADAVGMSTVPESIAAHHCGMRILGVTLIANMAAGMLPKPLSEREVLEAAAEAQPRFSKLILEFLKEA